VRLGSAPPRQRLAWLEFLRAKGCRAQVSVDMFEPFLAAEPDTCREACARADLIFLNAAEYRGLYDGRPHTPVPVIRKHGSGGAEFLAPGLQSRIPAPPVGEVDSIGAGEILAGTFLTLRAPRAGRGLAERYALTCAVTVATRSATEFGVAGPGVTAELGRVRAELAATSRV
jgi:sugar/nucleoside kinase (ribokinase family)